MNGEQEDDTEKKRSAAANANACVAIIGITLIAYLCTRQHLHAHIDRRIPRAQAQIWMLEALPGIGPKKRAPTHQALQQHQDHKLPRSAQVYVPLVFKE